MRTVGLWMLLAGCPDPEDIGKDVADSDTVVTSDETDGGETAALVETGAPEAEVERFEPVGFFVEAWFAYDPATDASPRFVFETLDTYAFLLVYVYDASWKGDLEDTAHHCVVRLIADEALPGAAWIDPYPGFVFGLGLPTQPMVSGDCDGRLGSGAVTDVVARVGALQWGVAVSGLMMEEVATALLEAGLSEDDLLQLVGGGLIGDVVDLIQPDALLPNAYVQGYRVDASFRVELNGSGDPRPLDGAEMVIDDSLQAGIYVLDTLGITWALLADAIGVPRSP